MANVVPAQRDGRAGQIISDGLGCIGLLAVVFLLCWAAYRVVTSSIPADVENILVKNHMIVVMFPSWALLVWVGVFLAGQTSQGTFVVKMWDLEFSGGGGAALIWVLGTLLGILIIGKFWVAS